MDTQADLPVAPNVYPGSRSVLASGVTVQAQLAELEESYLDLDSKFTDFKNSVPKMISEAVSKAYDQNLILKIDDSTFERFANVMAAAIQKVGARTVTRTKSDNLSLPLVKLTRPATVGPQLLQGDLYKNTSLETLLKDEAKMRTTGSRTMKRDGLLNILQAQGTKTTAELRTITKLGRGTIHKLLCIPYKQGKVVLGSQREPTWSLATKK